ncbi:TorD/DmsD family molecular chaperone [Pelomicrobium methylotrophicum]|uniref:Molecular chaperone TorD family protein n=1 Tax=Pelomicrobium methylotrophicum TaxID=2602750 RepID=A0A5C7EHH1_9PROT|nr:molecular chaperone TorD family protein [Pelomicrobium methylotrophicum]TXF09976.1 molecular chaperone TorD family protein [Pelomicrobium methylotrophicum]
MLKITDKRPERIAPAPAEGLRLRAEFYLCLARAFLPPRTEADFHALTALLADDLGDLARRLDYPIADELSEFRAAASALADPISLLRTYAALFLTPPAPVPINGGIYLDGSLMGESVRAMEDCYRRCGVERDERFRDLSDHMAVQLEFVAYLYARAAESPAGEAELPLTAGEFLGAFPRRWLPAFCDKLETATRKLGIAPNPYTPLARILRCAVAKDAVPVPDPLAQTERPAPPPLDDRTLHEMARVLRERGLSAEHLRRAGLPPIR